MWIGYRTTPAHRCQRNCDKLRSRAHDLLNKSRWRIVVPVRAHGSIDHYHVTYRRSSPERTDLLITSTRRIVVSVPHTRIYWSLPRDASSFQCRAPDLLITSTWRIVVPVPRTRTYWLPARDASSFLSRAQRPTDHLHVTHRRFCHGHRDLFDQQNVPHRRFCHGHTDLLITSTWRIVVSITGTRTYWSLPRNASPFSTSVPWLCCRQRVSAQPYCPGRDERGSIARLWQSGCLLG